MSRCYVCRRRSSALRASGPNPDLKVCSGCFAAAPRVIELERREAALFSSLCSIQGVTELAEVLEEYGHDGENEWDDARRILRQVADDCAAHRANTHAIITISEYGEVVHGCSMPGCRICAVAHLARSFCERMGWL